MSPSRAVSALVLCGLFALAGCSGKAAPAGAASTSASASAHGRGGTTASPADVTVPGVVQVGPYVQVFDTAVPADPAQAQVIEDFREAQVLWERSSNDWRLVAPVTEYVTGTALTHLNTVVANAKKQDIVPGGTDRFFKTRVTTVSDLSATITTCDDGSKFHQVNPRTGKVDQAYEAQPNQQYLFETWDMTQLAGRWAISDFSLALLPDKHAIPCQP